MAIARARAFAKAISNKVNQRLAKLNAPVVSKRANAKAQASLADRYMKSGAKAQAKRPTTSATTACIQAQLANGHMPEGMTEDEAFFFREKA